MPEVRGYEPSQTEVNPDNLLKTQLFEVETKGGVVRGVQNRPEKKATTPDITDDEDKRLRAERKKDAEQSLTTTGAKLIKAGLSQHFNLLAELQSKNSQTFVDLFDALSLKKGGGFEQLLNAEDDEALLFELRTLNGTYDLQQSKNAIENIVKLL